MHPKLIIHRLDSSWNWERQRRVGRRQRLLFSVALAGVALLLALRVSASAERESEDSFKKSVTKTTDAVKQTAAKDAPKPSGN